MSLYALYGSKNKLVIKCFQRKKSLTKSLKISQLLLNKN
jgi:hypothetical protein